MTTTTPTIELPRLDGESTKAYTARREYVLMGPQRSQEAVSKRLGKSRQLMYRWATQYNWTDSARQYDEQISYLTVQQAAEQYQADLAAHRKRAMDASKNLLILAGQLSEAMNTALKSPRTVRGEDGKVYKLHNIEITAGTLGTISKALTTSLDLEAHALGLDQLMPTLSTDDSE